MSLPRSRLHEYFDRYTYNVGLNGTRHLSDVYDKCSDTKKEIWKDIQKDAADCNACGLSVITFNQKYFTAGFLYKKDGKVIFRLYLPSGTGELVLGPNEIAEFNRLALWR